VFAVGFAEMVPPFEPTEYFTLLLSTTATLVALVAVTVKVDLPPAAMEVGFAMMVTVASGFTVTVTDAVAFVPPDPVAVAV
jgi:hypothetical protein